MDQADIARALRAVVRGWVDDSPRRRAEYSSDASNYRVVPQVVVFPRDVDDLLAAAQVARETGTPLTTRGAGTSIAGNAVGTGIVLDTSRHLGQVLEIDPQAQLARVQPGVILGRLLAAARPHGLRFGPDPSTWSRATLGGMIGNNACGAHALAYGRTADNVIELDVLDGTGRRFTAGRGLGPVPGLDALVGANLALLRTEFGRLRRQVSGYSLEHLLPENGADLAKALAGTEGTVVTILGATVRLVPGRPGARARRARLPGRAGGGRRGARHPAAPAAGHRGPGRPDGGRGAPPQGRRPGAGPAARGRLADDRDGRRLPGRGTGPGAGHGGRRGRPRRGGHPGRAAGRRGLGDPGGRRRAGRADPGQPAGLARLGGRRRTAGTARCLPAGVPRPAGLLPAGRPAVRALR